MYDVHEHIILGRNLTVIEIAYLSRHLSSVRVLAGDRGLQRRRLRRRRGTTPRTRLFVLSSAADSSVPRPGGLVIGASIPSS